MALSLMAFCLSFLLFSFFPAMLMDHPINKVLLKVDSLSDEKNDTNFVFASIFNENRTIQSVNIGNTDNNHSNNELNNADVTVTVFYESLCIDSIRLFTDQLYFAYAELKEYINLELVPYGKAKRFKHIVTQKWNYECQHGKEECYFNKLHACVLDKVNDYDLAVRFITCIMRGRLDENFEVLKQCRICFNTINMSDIFNCTNSSEGEALLAQHAEKTEKYYQVKNYVPTLLFNDVYDENDSNKINEGKLHEVICKYIKKKPHQCKNIERLTENIKSQKLTCFTLNKDLSTTLILSNPEKDQSSLEQDSTFF